jgi:hypothetical protein
MYVSDGVQNCCLRGRLKRPIHRRWCKGEKLNATGVVCFGMRQMVALVMQHDCNEAGGSCSKGVACHNKFVILGHFVHAGMCLAATKVRRVGSQERSPERTRCLRSRTKWHGSTLVTLTCALLSQEGSHRDSGGHFCQECVDWYFSSNPLFPPCIERAVKRLCNQPWV